MSHGAGHATVDRRSGGAAEAERRPAPGHLSRVVEGWRRPRGAPGSGQRLLLLQDERRDNRRERLCRLAAYLSREPARYRRGAIGDNGATFAPPTRVSEDGWKIDACPDDGPAMVADGHGGIHIVWPTLVPETRRGRGSSTRPWSEDAFAPRIRLDAGDGDPAHPQIAADEHLNTAAVWDERVGDGRRIVFRTIVDKVAAAGADVYRRRAPLSSCRRQGRVLDRAVDGAGRRRPVGYRGPADSVAAKPLMAVARSTATCSNGSVAAKSTMGLAGRRLTRRKALARP